MGRAFIHWHMRTYESSNRQLVEIMEGKENMWAEWAQLVAPT